MRVLFLSLWKNIYSGFLLASLVFFLNYCSASCLGIDIDNKQTVRLEKTQQLCNNWNDDSTDKDDNICEFKNEQTFMDKDDLVQKLIKDSEQRWLTKEAQTCMLNMSLWNGYAQTNYPTSQYFMLDYSSIKNSKDAYLEERRDELDASDDELDSPVLAFNSESLDEDNDLPVHTNDQNRHCEPSRILTSTISVSYMRPRQRGSFAALLIPYKSLECVAYYYVRNHPFLDTEDLVGKLVYGLPQFKTVYTFPQEQIKGTRKDLIASQMIKNLSFWVRELEYHVVNFQIPSMVEALLDKELPTLLEYFSAIFKSSQQLKSHLHNLCMDFCLERFGLDEIIVGNDNTYTNDLSSSHDASMLILSTASRFKTFKNFYKSQGRKIKDSIRCSRLLQPLFNANNSNPESIDLWIGKCIARLWIMTFVPQNWLPLDTKKLTLELLCEDQMLSPDAKIFIRENLDQRTSEALFRIIQY